ncbi:MAG: hypothetical protein RB292_02525 [Patescibacteria group bacterium]|jgi:hypothetical protein|nr:hypothetical protein [Patescibacteria group bacterium]
MNKRWFAIIKILVILLPLGLGLWLINKNVPVYGDLVINADFQHAQGALSLIGPEIRTKYQDGVLAILESPVYFDLRSLPWFKAARIYLTFKSQGAALEGLAPQVGPGWQYQLIKPMVIMDLDDGWQKAVFEFNLTEIYQAKNVKRFLISTIPQTDGGLLIKDLTIILVR